jgi:hypothetical protein
MTACLLTGISVESLKDLRFKPKAFGGACGYAMGSDSFSTAPMHWYMLRPGRVRRITAGWIGFWRIRTHRQLHMHPVLLDIVRLDEVRKQRHIDGAGLDHLSEHKALG